MTHSDSEPSELIDIPISLVPQIERFIAQGAVGCPFYESAVPGGFPSPAQDNSYRTVNVLSLVIPHPDQTILVRMPDNSLEEEGIFQDDVLIAERENFPKEGDLTVCTYCGETCLSRFTEDDFGTDGPEVIAVVRYRIHTLYGKQFF